VQAAQQRGEPVAEQRAAGGIHNVVFADPAAFARFTLASRLPA